MTKIQVTVPVTPRELMGGIMPALESLLYTDMPTSVASILGKNWKYCNTLALKMTERRREYLESNNLVEMDASGKPKLETPEGGKEPEFVFVSPVARQQYIQWDTDFLDKTPYELPVHVLSKERLDEIPAIKPMVLLAIQKLTEEYEQEPVLEAKQPAQEPATA